MACAKNAARRLFFVSFIFIAGPLFFAGNCTALAHGTEVIKPSFFFSPLSYCGFQALYQEKKTSSSGLRFFAAPYYSKNFSRHLIAAGLGASNTASFTVAPKSLTGDVDSDHLIAVLRKNNNPLLQTIDETTTRPHATITFDPEQRELGVQLVAHQDLDFLINGMFYKLEACFVRQTRKLNATYSAEYTSKISTADIISINQFFSGDTQSICEPLLSLKLAQKEITNHGIESVQATLGYNIFDKNDYRLAIVGAVQLPCGPTHNLEYLFSPNIGLKHLQFGIGWNGYLKIAGNETTAWFLSNNAMIGYSFPAHEPRIPTIKNLPWGHYQQMLAQNTPAYTTSTPGADILPHSINVKQGISLQDTFILGYKHENTRLEIGFSGGYREGEHNVTSAPWADNGVAIANRYINPYNFTGATNNATPPAFTVNGLMFPATTGRLLESRPTAGFNIGTDINGNPIPMIPVTTGAWAQNMATKIINKADLELNLPTLFSYQAFVSAAKTFCVFNVDGTLNIGGHITFGEPSELVIRNYQLWIGLGISF